MTVRRAEDSASMRTEGTQIQARRERLGISKKELAEIAGVSRDTLAAIEEGRNFRRASLVRLDNALTSLEHEAGMDAPAVESSEEGLVEFDFPDGGGGRIVVRGPVADKDDLARMVANLIRETRESDQP